MKPVYNSNTGRVSNDQPKKRRRIGQMPESLSKELKSVKEYSKQEHARLRIAASMVVLSILGQ